MRPLKQIAIASTALFISLQSFGDEAKQEEPNPVLEEILQYDVIFTAKYQSIGGNGRFVIQEQIKGVNTELILERVKTNARLGNNARLGIEDGDKFLFMFGKNGARGFRMTRFNWAKRICRWVDKKYWCVSIEDIEQAVKN